MTGMIGSLAHAVPAAGWRGVSRFQGQRASVCVVALHRVSDHYLADELSFPRAGFLEMCRYWHDHFEVVSLDRLLRRLPEGFDGAAPVLAITFDDGYADNWELAAPILDLHSLPATFFVTSGAVGARSNFAWDRGWVQPPRMLSWDQVRELHAAGFGIGSHTVTHARLTAVRGDALAYEVEESRRRIEQELGAPVEDFAVPFGQPGDCDEEARAAVRRAGYRCCFSCHGGVIQAGASPWALPRLALSPRYHSTPRGFARGVARHFLFGRSRWSLMGGLR